MNTFLSLGIGTPEILIILFSLAYAALFIFCLLDILRSSFKDSTTKLIWVLVILFAPFLGSLIYLVIGRKGKTY